MPSELIHLKVAYKVQKKIKKLNLNMYYSGILCPDSVNINGFADKQIRWSSHLRDKDLDTWQKNVITFYKENKNKIEKDYLFGFLVHILTDIEFDRYFEIYKKTHNNLPTDKIFEDYQLQIRLYEENNLNSLFWRNKVLKKLTNPYGQNVNNLSEDLVKNYINKINNLLSGNLFSVSSYTRNPLHVIRILFYFSDP